MSIPLPPVPADHNTWEGMYRCYLMDDNGMQGLSNFFWSDLFSVASITKLFIDVMSAMFDLSIIPVHKTLFNTTPMEVKIGNAKTGVNGGFVNNEFISFSSGVIPIDPKYNSFLDYAPYTKVSIYIPYIGTVELNTDEVMGYAIKCHYCVSVLSGDVHCSLVRTKLVGMYSGDGNQSCIGEYSGNCKCSLPITANDWNRVITSLLVFTGSAAAGGAMIASGASSLGAANALSRVNSTVGAPATGVVSELVDSGARQMMKGAALIGAAGVGAVMGSKMGVQGSSQIKGYSGLMGHQKLLATIIRPDPVIPSSLPKLFGRKCYFSDTIGSCTGFTKVGEINLSDIPAPTNEVSMLYDALSSGIYINGRPIKPNEGFAPTDPNQVRFTLCFNSSPANYTNKNLTYKQELSEGTFKEPFDISEPVVIFRTAGWAWSPTQEINYVLMKGPQERRYFVTKIVSLNVRMIEVHMKIDVVSSYWDEYSKQTAIIERQETRFDPYLTDEMIACRQNTISEHLVEDGSGGNGFTNRNFGITFICAGD